MNFRILVMSKTFWTGIASIVSGITIIVQGDTNAGVQLIATGLVAIFIRDGIASK